MRIIRKLYHAIVFLSFYFYKLVEANMFMAWDILTPKMHDQPGFIDVDVKLTSETGILMLSNLVSMTPGTLVVDANLKKKLLKVHVLYLRDEQKKIKEILHFQQMIMKITG